MPIASLGPCTGSVTEFDEDRGLGVVTDDGGRVYPFHCTGIADGSRRIDTGLAVRFDVIAGRMGRWEAWGIEPR